MRQLGDSISQSMNVIYPDIWAGEQFHASLSILADKIVDYIVKLEQSGKLKSGWEYIIVWHSIWWALAVLVWSKLKTKHIIQVSTPNDAPDVAKISGLGFIPAILDLRDIKSQYSKVKMSPQNPIQRLTTVMPENDKFIWTKVQSNLLIPPNISITRTDRINMKWGHIDPILTPSWIKQLPI